jgi:hypothetical protein
MLKRKRENARANYSRKRLFCTGRERGIFDRGKKKEEKEKRKRKERYT